MVKIIFKVRVYIPRGLSNKSKFIYDEEIFAYVLGSGLFLHHPLHLPMQKHWDISAENGYRVVRIEGVSLKEIIKKSWILRERDWTNIPSPENKKAWNSFDKKPYGLLKRKFVEAFDGGSFK